MSSEGTILELQFVENLYVAREKKETTYNSLNFFSEFSALGDFRASILKCELELECEPPSSKKDTDTNDTESRRDRNPWSMIDQGTKTSPLVLLRRLMKSRKYHDLEVFIGGVQFNCHITLLQTYSSYFWNIDQLRTTRVDLDEKDISSKGFDMVYEWILNDFPDIPPSDLPYLFQGGCFLGIDKLVKQCWRYLDNDLGVREFESIRMYMEHFRDFELNSLRELFLSRVCKYFLPLVASELFLSLDFIEVCVLLSSNTIGVNTESEVLMAAMRWITHDPERKVFTEQLMSCIRFELMSMAYLALLSTCTFCPIVKEAVGIEKVSRRILNAMCYATDMQFTYMDVKHFHKYEADNLELPRQRQWLIDPKCSYHHKLLCPTTEKLSFANFEKYVETLKGCCPDYWKNFEFTTLTADGPCSNQTCVLLEHKVIKNWADNRQLCIKYVRYYYGKPTLKVSDNIQDFINNSYIKIPHLLTIHKKNKKSLRILEIEMIEKAAFGIPKDINSCESATDEDTLDVQSAPENISACPASGRVTVSMSMSMPNVVDDKIQDVPKLEKPKSEPVLDGLGDKHFHFHEGTGEEALAMKLTKEVLSDTKQSKSLKNVQNKKKKKAGKK